MPRLRPQKLSGLVVIPTIDLTSGVFKVTLGIDVGMSRTGSAPPQVISREDLIVEVKNATDGSFEPIGSPEPGPLPVRALRVIQARGDFTFSQGANPPDEVVVTVRNDRKSFPMSQTMPTTACMSKEPAVGDPFPPRKLFPLFRRCCVRRFAAPLNVQTNAAAKSESFDVHATFGAARGLPAFKFGCQCGCCEYRQFVRGTFTDGGTGQPVLFDLPSGPLDATRYCEDGAIDEFGTNQHGYYGHRNHSTPGDTYGGLGGCSYEGNEKSSCPPSDTAHLEFVGLIVDVCRRRVSAKQTWTVAL